LFTKRREETREGKMGKVGDFLNAWNERKAHLHAFDMNSEILD